MKICCTSCRTTFLISFSFSLWLAHSKGKDGLDLFQVNRILIFSFISCMLILILHNLILNICMTAAEYFLTQRSKLKKHHSFKIMFCPFKNAGQSTLSRKEHAAWTALETWQTPLPGLAAMIAVWPFLKIFFQFPAVFLTIPIWFQMKKLVRYNDWQLARMLI